MTARRRRYYKTQIDGQLSFEDLERLAAQEDTSEQVRPDGAQPLGEVAASTVRGDSGPGQLLLGDWPGSSPADRRADGADRGDRQPGEGYLETAGRLAAARSQAEEIILPQQILPEPEPGTGESPEQAGQALPGAGRPAVIGPDHPLWAEVNAEQQERLGLDG